ncbi:MAG: hypothetical protein MUC88_18480 [Planctomycetes bacterium]|jgi:hypothetical protein|nr:hypothetical protein [Planctomycetota bacterium]
MKIAVECYPDEAVLRALGVPRRFLLHEPRKGEVFNWLRKTPAATGMVDEDPDSAQPRDLISYQQVQAGEGLLLLTRQGNSGQRLIVVRPRLEDWLIQRAKICGVDPKRYQLPGTAKELHDIPRYEQKDGFRRFLAELSRDRGMSLLRQWIRPR